MDTSEPALTGPAAGPGGSQSRGRLTTRDVLDRYGPAAAVIAALFLLVALLPSNVSDQPRFGQNAGTGDAIGPGAASGSDPTVAVGPDSTVAAGAGPGAAGGAGGPGGTGGGASGNGGGAGEGGTGGTSGGDPASPAAWGPGRYPAPGPETVCREDGRIPGFSRGGPFNMPPCVPLFEGDNGGATWQGVTEDTIKVVRYIGVDQFTIAAVRGAGADDDPETAFRVDRALVHYFNNHMETYGRAVEIINYEASGTDDAAARADARDIVSRHKPFLVYPMVFTGAVENILAEELAAAGVMCICTSTLPASFYQRLAPFAFPITLPTLEEYYSHLAEFFGKRLHGGEAVFARGASVPPLDTSVRKFGLIFFEGSPPVPERKQAVDFFKEQLARFGVTLTHVNSYTDVANATQSATNLVAQHKSAGVTTLLCMCDGLSPIFLTQAATRNQYFPEWINPGTVLMDTTFTGRLYDKAQWRNSFGISPLWVFFRNVQSSSGFAAYHHARPGDRPGDEGIQVNVRQSPLQILFTGIQMAGPELTPHNFALGLYRLPPTGGTPKAPLIFWTPESHSSIKDFVEIWWDEDGTGLDETGKQGVGVLVKARGGQRYALGEWPSEPPYAFQPEGIVFTSDDPPETFDHDADGHTHGHADDPDRQRCRSC